MGRTKICQDKTLLEKLESFWINDCKSNPDKLTYKTFSEHLQAQGIPVSKDTLKHNQLICERMKTLKEAFPFLDKPSSDTAGNKATELDEQVKKLQETNQKLADFISRTYVQSICRSLVNQELGLNMDTGLQEGAAQAGIITAGTEPFQSPIIEEFSQMFDFQEDKE